MKTRTMREDAYNLITRHLKAAGDEFPEASDRLKLIEELLFANAVPDRADVAFHKFLSERAVERMEALRA